MMPLFFIMNISIFLLFIGLGILLFYLGLRFRDDDINISMIMSAIGAFFILMSGLFVLGLGVDFKVGVNETYSYVCNACGTPGNTTFYCGGNGTECSFYNNNEISCELYGCTFNVTNAECYGSPYECSVYNDDLTSCGRSGCDVLNITTNGTAGINATILSGMEQTYTYESLKGGFDSYGLSFALFFLGFVMSLITYLNYVDYKNKKQNREYYEEEE